MNQPLNTATTTEQITTTANKPGSAYDSTAVVIDTNGIKYLISCFEKDSDESILAKATKFYDKPMSKVLYINRLQ